ncbi:uncharacterized protein K452DRAFT_205304, partial [Aplosporella prunicola CBS 121167]
PFRSARLIYHALEDTPEDDAFVHSVQSDAQAYVGSTTSLLRPESRKASESFRAHLENLLLGVIVCLAPPPSVPPAAPVPIGIIYLTSPRPGREHHRNSYISVDIVAPHQRQGYGSEAIEWVLNWGFQIAGLHRIAIESLSYNEGATRLYERLGFVLEGRKREAIWYNGEWHDMISFSMLEDEWRNKQRK